MVSPVPSAPRGMRRWGIGLLLSCGVLVNYFDRIAVSVAGPQLQDQLGLTPVELGWLLSGFFWSYAVAQIPIGMLLDRLGVSLLTRLSTLGWGLATIAAAFSGGFGSLMAARVVLGVAEAPGFPASSKATGMWFPRTERALATALFDAAAKFANVIGVPLIGGAVVVFGWRWGFVLTGVLSLLYCLAFTLRYRDPSQDRRLGHSERDYIRAGGAVPEHHVHGDGGPAMLGRVLRSRKVWGLALGFAAYGYSFYLFLTWLPNYLVHSLHMNLMQSAGIAAIPWACATVSDLVIGGWLIDFLIRRGGDETRVRKTVLVCGMLLGLSVFGATLTTDPRWAVLFISLALTGLAAAAPVGWSLPSLIAPPGGTATVGSLMNLLNNLSGAAAPVITGYAVAATGSYVSSFAIAGAVLVCGILCFTLMLGRIEPIGD